MNKPLLHIENLTKRYPGLTAVDDVSLAIHPGEIFALLGPNGAGKTTLINCVCGMVLPFEGRIRVSGFDVRQDYAITRRLVGVVPQELNFDGFFMARKVLAYQAGLFGRSRVKERAQQLLADFRLTSKAEANTRWLSGGMKRRLMICKALIHEPALLFLDEPTAGVDVDLRDELWAYVRKLRDNGTTVFLTTHYLEEAEQLADRIGILRDGRILLVETTRGLQERFGRRWMEIRFRARVGDNTLNHLQAFQPERIDDFTLRFAYRVGAHPAESNVVDSILKELRELGQQIESIDGRSSSLEDIFREVLRLKLPQYPTPRGIAASVETSFPK